MATVVIEEEACIPDSVTDLASFRRWACSDEFPARGRFSFLRNVVWVDMSPEDLLAHAIVKGEIAAAITTLLKSNRRGKFFPDGTLLTNNDARLSTEPDGVFVSWNSLKSRRARLVRWKRGFMELQGTPDLALEVVSHASVEKDTVQLKRLYWKAGIPEYWLVDVRAGKLRFDILRRTRAGYAPASRKAGWQRSEILGRSFKLTVGVDELGYPEYTLHHR